MMQTLKLMDITVIGDEYSKEFPNKEVHPKGCWELPMGKTINGINHDNYKGCAVKLFGYQLSNTNPKHISKLIICDRNKKDAIKSTINWLSKENYLNIPVTESIANKIYEENYAYIYGYEADIPKIKISYESMVSDSMKTISKVAEFVGYNGDISNAQNNIGV